MDIVRPINAYVTSAHSALHGKKKKILARVVNLGTFYKVYPFHEMV